MADRRSIAQHVCTYIGRMDSDCEKLLAIATDALRSERDVRLAVLFGSTATGEDRPDSDVDLLIARRSSTARARAALSIRLSKTLSKRAHLVDLEHAEAAPMLLADVLLEGRLLIDRDGLWAGLLGRRSEIVSRARSEEAALSLRAQEAIRDITAGIEDTDRC
jgi:predicted nucleotidyltransferase